MSKHTCIVLAGDQHCAPVVTGVDRITWSGKTSVEITDAEIHAMLEFCTDAGEQQGWTDGAGKYEYAENPFDPAFLSGAPNMLWHLSYSAGYRRGHERTRIIPFRSKFDESLAWGNLAVA